MNRVLSENYLVLASSPDPENVYAGSPSITRMRSGRLLASYEWFRPSPLKEAVPDQTEVLVSDDDGATWNLTARLDFIWATIWSYEDDAYLIGNRRKSRDIVIGRSRDGGSNWEGPVTLFEGRHHCAPTPVLIHNGHAYRAFETCDAPSRFDWKSLVVAGDLSKDLLDPASWRMSNHVRFPGIPDVLSQRRYPESATDKVPADSFLEGNIVLVNGEIRMIMRTIVDGHTTSSLASIGRVEDDGETLDYRFVQFHPMPGAQCKFQIVHDEKDGLYWTTVTLSTNPWQDREPLRRIGFSGPPGNERRILMLMYSADALNWFQAGCVAMSTRMMESFSYASQVISGNDLLVVARTARGGRNQHDTNLITLHRVKDFLDLALDLRPVDL
ncbi:MAG: sialidase family protein [Gemmatimonadetes bacterium]|nr:sialidase family protein [Gemmatimonadota bacterium]